MFNQHVDPMSRKRLKTCSFGNALLDISDGALDPILRLTIAASKLSFSGSLSSIG
jgi:hypothetical protein